MNSNVFLYIQTVRKDFKTALARYLDFAKERLKNSVLSFQCLHGQNNSVVARELRVERPCSSFTAEPSSVITREWRKLHIEKFHILNPSPVILRQICLRVVHIERAT